MRKDYASNFGFGTPQSNTLHNNGLMGESNTPNKLKNIGRAGKLMTVRSEVESMKKDQSKGRPLGVKLL